MAGNGMKTFSVHVTEGGGLEEMGVLAGAGAPGLDGQGEGHGGVLDRLRDDLGFPIEALRYEPPAAEDPEVAARDYLDRALASDELPLVTAEPVGKAVAEFRSLGAEQLPLTGTQTVKFRQEYGDVPVYGSLVTVEMDEANQLISLNSAIGTPTDVDPRPAISRERAIEVAMGAPDTEDADSEALDAGLYYWFDSEQSIWRLVYIVKDCPTHLRDGAPPELADVIVDAHDGSIVADLPRFQNAMREDAVDALGRTRAIAFIESNGGKFLNDEALGVETYDFDFHDARLEHSLLPGQSVANPPSPWDPAAVSAHANAMMVATYVSDVLRRNGLDGQGSKYRSSVRCTFDGSGQEWRNAAWYGDQMIFGQRRDGGTFRSYAVAADVVAHEMFHGLTSATARLEYKGMPGALNESYSDIFGVIISNADKTDPAAWNWQIGEDLSGTGLPLRDLSDPARYGQPAHLSDYQDLSLDQQGDWGGVHLNSGIHNHAAYRLLIAGDGLGGYEFEVSEVAAVFYLALSQHLTRTSTFGRSRRGVKLAARTLFRNDRNLSRKLDAIDESFDAVGIDEEI
jgi:Zn-dependent metalloprotease